MEKIYQEKNQLVEKLNYLKVTLREYKNLEHRSNCPYCGQKIEWKYFSGEIPKIQEEIESIDNRLNEIFPIIRKLDHEKSIAYDKRVKEQNERVELYLKQNRSKLNKAIREYDNGVEVYMPNISNNTEKELWNEAMVYQLDKRGLDDNDELCFEVI